jgi:hypothetical protein
LYQFVRILDKPFVKIRRGKKESTCEHEDQQEVTTNNTHSINEINNDDIYEKIDPDKDLDLIETNIEKREFFERIQCRFGKPDPLAANTHFRTHKEAKILTRGDRDIIIKRTTQEVIIL